MASKSNTKLKNLFKFLDECFEIKANSIIITIPGLGCSHLLKQYSEYRKVNYINDLSKVAGIKNIVDVNIGTKHKEFRLVNKFFTQERGIKPKNTFIFVIDNPILIKTSEYETSEISKHVYKIFNFGEWDESEIKDFIDEQNVKVTDNELKHLMILSGGIPRIVKFLIFNKEYINEEIKDYASRSDFKKLIEPTIKVVYENKLEDLENLGFVKGGEIISKVLSWYFEFGGYELNSLIDVKTNLDLSFFEKGIKSEIKLTKFEKDVVDFCVSNKIIEREKIAEIKWKDESYESFSDQAINQSVLRINSKLKFHKLTPISKVGYKLISI